MVRTLVVRVADWPVVAAGVELDEPAAVFFANRVMALSPPARSDGVAIGQRRREAQARCPELIVLHHDPARDARAFEPVLAVLEELTPRIEVSAAGQCAFPTRGPSRLFGGDDALASRARSLVQEVVGERARVQVGVADGPFAAALAASGETVHGVRVVAPGASSDFLARLPLSTLERPELVDVLGRLGLRSLGDFAALPHADVLARFGSDGASAHRLASGDEERSPVTRPPAPELAVQAELDPPAERVEAVAFLARSLADELHARLAARGQACTRVLIAVESEHGERLERLWRHEGALSAGAIADRARWQLDGWLNRSSCRPTAGITLLRLVPDEVTAATGRQLGFWGGAAGADERVLRALARVEGLLGPDAVTVPEWRGGRDPAELVGRVPAGAVDLTSTRPTADPGSRPEPWPGRMPAPSPASVAPAPLSIEVTDEHGDPVRVSGRGTLSAAPARVRVGDRQPCAVIAWAGPWPVEERWWDERRARRRARFQIVTDDGTARLVTLERGKWWLEAVYD